MKKFRAALTSFEFTGERRGTEIFAQKSDFADFWKFDANLLKIQNTDFSKNFRDCRRGILCVDRL